MKSTRARIDDQELLRAYCLTWQAERSVDHGLGDWKGVQAYYAGLRRSRVLECGEALASLLPSAWVVDHDQLRSVVTRRVWARLGLSGTLLDIRGRLTPRWIQRDEIAFVVSSLRQLVDRLEDNDPPRRALVELRMDLRTCADLMGIRCRRFKEVDRADRIENYGQPSFLPHYSLDEIVPV